MVSATDFKRIRDKLRKQVLEGVTHYEVLGVPPAAKPEVIKGAQRYLASAFHPDRCHLPDASSLMATVNVAYDCLMDPVARRKYDTINHTKADACTTCKGQGKVLKQKGFNKKLSTACPTCGGTGCL